MHHGRPSQPVGFALAFLCPMKWGIGPGTERIGDQEVKPSIFQQSFPQKSRLLRLLIRFLDGNMLSLQECQMAGEVWWVDEHVQIRQGNWLVQTAPEACIKHLIGQLGLCQWWWVQIEATTIPRSGRGFQRSGSALDLDDWDGWVLMAPKKLPEKWKKKNEQNRWTSYSSWDFLHFDDLR